MKSTRTITILIFLCLVSLIPRIGFCEADQHEEKVFAVQNKLFHRFHEIAFTTGYGPDEDFYNPYPLGLSYTYHFNDFLAWEVINGKWLWNQEKDLKSHLQNDFWVTAEAFDEPKYMLHTNLVITPLYGKQAVWNRGVINQESYFLIGAGMMSYKLHYSDPELDKTENSPSVSLGVGTKLFLNQNLCLNFEVRDLVNFRESDIDNRLWLGIGIGFRFNFTPRATVPETETEVFRDYLKRKN